MIGTTSSGISYQLIYIIHIPVLLECYYIYKSRVHNGIIEIICVVNFISLIVQINHKKLMLEKTDGSITNGNSRDTGDIGHRTQNTGN
jgi:hypothetical protein